MAAYYNEIDPYAAEWLRNLITAGHIAAGYVDTRDIRDVRPADLAGYDQCHFFAGIGVWSHALRMADWPDARQVWTGSCPCQPFSAAGRGAGFDDERHLWPAWQWLIRQCQPATIFGEQVASRDAEPWIDLVHADLEALGYAVGCVPFPSAGVSAPHIRDRMYWMANAASARLQGRESGGQRPNEQQSAAERGCEASGLGDPDSSRRAPGRQAAETARHGVSVAADGGVCGMADAVMQQRSDRKPRIGDVDATEQWDEGAATLAGLRSDMRPGPVNGFWRDADWLACRDGKWRPVSAIPQPLVDGSSESLGRVRPEILSKVEEEINASTAQSPSFRTEAMRNLLEDLGAKAKQSWAFGGLPGLHEAPFLLAFMRQLQKQGWRVAKRISVSCPQAFAPELRGMRNDEESASPSRERGLEGQPTGEHSDTLSVLSSLLARHASEAWGDAYAAHAETGFPLADGARSRGGRLRAYGNAINAEAARVFIEASMQSID